MNAVVDNNEEVVVKERYSISRRNGEPEEDYPNSVPMSKRLDSKIASKKSK